MAGYQTTEIQRLTGAVLSGRTTNSIIEHLLIDSRKLVFPQSTLFFAIKSDKRDGHDFIEDLYLRGVRNFIVSKEIEITRFSGAQFLYVVNVIDALQLIVAAHRAKFNYPVIGITGSNAKTIVKEWLYHLLQYEYRIVRSPRSYNSQLGVPLSIWQMTEANDLGIFEAGISHEGEMKKLEAMIKPDIGIITNIGEAHSEGFETMSFKLDEKLQLFSKSKLLVYCKDHEMIDKAIQKKKHDGQLHSVLCWGITDAADIRVIEKYIGSGYTQITVLYGDAKYTFKIPFTDAAAIENALHCFAVCIYLKKANDILIRMTDLPPLSMRLEIKEGQNQCTLINDSYNADLNGLLSALDFMGMQGDKERRTVILSDISGVVGNAEQTYREIAKHLVQKKVQKVIAIGSAFKQFSFLFEENEMQASFYLNVEDFLKSFHTSNFHNEVILIKGSRSFRFERISHLLEKKIHQTRLEINLSAITHNLKEYRAVVQKGTGMMVMVKAFSYGSGSYEIANLLQFHRIEYLAVAYVDEGVELRKSGIRLPIMVMNTEPQAFPELLEYNLEPEIYSMEIAILFNKYLQQEGMTFFPVHLKLDTGMHRLGFETSNLDELIELICSENSMKVQSVFTHLVASEDPAHDSFTKDQISLFERSCDTLKSSLGYTFFRHAANTAAISRHSQVHYEMVRLGIGLYGVDPGNTLMNLIESGTLKTTISQIKYVPKGDSVGYGRGAILKRDSIIATIRIGYADGYPRSVGNGNGYVWIKGSLVKTIGNVCMDMTMVDITDYPEISLSDDVVIFGKEYPISQLAKNAGTIPYEIMTGISQRVPRVYYGE